MFACYCSLASFQRNLFLLVISITIGLCILGAFPTVKCKLKCISFVNYSLRAEHFCSLMKIPLHLKNEWMNAKKRQQSKENNNDGRKKLMKENGKEWERERETKISQAKGDFTSIYAFHLNVLWNFLVYHSAMALLSLWFVK